VKKWLSKTPIAHAMDIAKAKHSTGYRPHQVTEHSISTAKRLLDLIDRRDISASMSGIEYYDREIEILKQRKLEKTGQ
jgi:hypothetical protein